MMKKIVLSFVLCVSLALASAQTNHSVTSVGLEFVPDTLVIMAGDTVTFSVGSTHPVQEVSQAEWNSNSLPAQPSGFAFPSGSGTFIFNAVKTHYYICTNHIQQNMKGIIIVQPSIGMKEASLTEMKIYPNPVRDFIQLDLTPTEGLEKVEIFNAIGQKQMEINLVRRLGTYDPINVSALSPGKYVLKVSNGETEQALSFVKK